MMMKRGKLARRVTEYFQDPLNGEEIVETFDDPKQDESQLVTDVMPETMAEISKQEGVSRPRYTNQEVEACDGCETKAGEARKVFADFVQQKIKILKKGHESSGVALLMGAPKTIGTAPDGHQKIKGTLAYAGVSLNNRLYLPEELAKGDGMTVPLIINHASTAGAEEEIQAGRVPQDVVQKLQNGEQHIVGEVTLEWDPELNTLFYEGHVADEFWQQEIVDANMAVSLGMYYDSDSPQVCNTQCYTVIRGAEFHEISLVYHPGFPIATIEAFEVRLKTLAVESIAQARELTFENYFMSIDKLIDISFANEDWKVVKGKTYDHGAYCTDCGEELDEDLDGHLEFYHGFEPHDEDWERIYEEADNYDYDSSTAEEIIGAIGMGIGAGARVGAGLAVKGAKAVGQQVAKSAASLSDTKDSTDTSSVTDTGVNEAVEEEDGRYYEDGSDKNDEIFYIPPPEDEEESKKKLVREVREVVVVDQIVVDQKVQEVLTQMKNLNQRLKTYQK
jgi:hypothetical protein